MDNGRHLYTVLAIMGFLSLPLVMNGEKALPLDIPGSSRLDPFHNDRIFPTPRRTLTPQPVSAGNAVPQRWIDETTACKKAVAARADVVQAAPPASAQRPCLIV